MPLPLSFSFRAFEQEREDLSSGTHTGRERLLSCPVGKKERETDHEEQAKEEGERKFFFSFF